MAGLRLYLLGPPRMELDGELVKFERRKSMALVAYLAISGRSHSRDYLATLLWPELDSNHSRAGLRRTLSLLNKALAGHWLVIKRDVVGSNPEADFYQDVNHFRSLLATWRAHGHPQEELCDVCMPVLEAAVSLYRADFMAGFTLRDSGNFDEWQFFQTEELRRELAAALTYLVHGLAGQQTFESAISYARRWLAIDPLHEPAHQALMQLYARSGQRAAALRQYAVCERLLKDELDLEPGTETSQLYQAIKGRKTLRPVKFMERRSQPGILNNRYRLDSEIGRGSLGIVYKGRDLLLGREVAVKVYSTSQLDQTGRSCLLAEATITARLNHQNIVSIYDAGVSDEVSFIISEFTPGRPLSSCLPLTLSESIDIARQICEGLHHAHEQGVVHRDLKPENIILTNQGVAKLTDFGLANAISARIKPDGTISGSVTYLAPELAMGKAYDQRADLYSLGAILYELTTGQPPFSAQQGLALIPMHLQAAVIPPQEKNPAISPKLDRLIRQLLCTEPSDRPASAAELLVILNDPEIINGDPVGDRNGASSRGLSSGRIMGREQELKQGLALWNKALAGHGQLLLVSGEAGTGKTRFILELATQAQLSGGQFLLGNCQSSATKPYDPFVAILHQALSRRQAADLYLPEFILEDLLKLDPSLRQELSRFALISPAEDMPCDQLRMFENLAIFFCAMCESCPLMLALEDIHWADEGTWQLLSHLVRSTRHRQLMMLVTCQDDSLVDSSEGQEVWRQLRRGSPATRLFLRPFSRSQTRKMVETLIDDSISPELAGDIFAETQGNPALIEQACEKLIGIGRIYSSG